jgi:hypothetical protein
MTPGMPVPQINLCIQYTYLCYKEQSLYYIIYTLWITQNMDLYFISHILLPVNIYY